MPDPPARTVPVAERRARLALRHRVAHWARSDDVVDAARSIVCLHGTDPGTVFLSAWARVDGMTVADLEHALYVDRSLVKHLAMRRTLFVFPRQTLSSAQAGASARVAEAERKRLVKEVEAAGLQVDGGRWLTDASQHVLAALADGRELTSTELRTEVPLLEGSMVYGEGRTWGGRISVGPRVLTTLSASGEIVRATNVGGWTTSRPRWSSMSAWLGEPLPITPTREAVADLVTWWLRAFGPGTVTDIKWWLGSTLTAVRGALVDVGAVPVDLDGRTGYLLPDDLAVVDPGPTWTALLPPLDPTTMGWFEREWYLGAYRKELFDTVGNAGPTAWWNGRIVGGWRQRDDASVELQLLEELPRTATRTLRQEADRLSAWFDGTRTLMRFPSPLSRTIEEAPVRQQPSSSKER